MVTVKGVMSYTIIKVPHYFTVSHATACNKQVHEKVGFLKTKHSCLYMMQLERYTSKI